MDLTVSTQNRDISTQGRDTEEIGTTGSVEKEAHKLSMVEPPEIETSFISINHQPNESMVTTDTELIKVAEVDGF